MAIVGYDGSVSEFVKRSFMLPLDITLGICEEFNKKTKNCKVDTETGLQSCVEILCHFSCLSHNFIENVALDLDQLGIVYIWMVPNLCGKIVELRHLPASKVVCYTDISGSDVVEYHCEGVERRFLVPSYIIPLKYIIKLVRELPGSVGLEEAKKTEIGLPVQGTNFTVIDDPYTEQDVEKAIKVLEWRTKISTIGREDEIGDILDPKGMSISPDFKTTAEFSICPSGFKTQIKVDLKENLKQEPPAKEKKEEPKLPRGGYF